MTEAEKEKLKREKKKDVALAAARAVLQVALEECGKNYEIIEDKSYISLAIPTIDGGLEVNLRILSVQKWRTGLNDFLAKEADYKTEAEKAKLAKSCGLTTGGRCHLRISKDKTVISCDDSAVYVHIGSDLCRIDSGAFYSKSNLRAIYFDKGVKIIDSYAFVLCKNLRSVKLPESLEVVGSNAFSLTGIEEIEIPDGVKQLARNCFSQCKELKKIKLGKGLRKIENSLFERCENLEMIDIPIGIFEIGMASFCACTALREVIGGENVWKIGSSAFSGCGVLEKLGFDAGKIEAIEDFAFKGCKNLCGRFDFAVLKSFGQGVFSGCEKIEQISISDAVKVLGDEVFLRCKRLSDFTLPVKLEAMGLRAFADCENLEKMRFNGKLSWWKSAMERSLSWKDGTKITAVQCADGIIEV